MLHIIRVGEPTDRPFDTVALVNAIHLYHDVKQPVVAFEVTIVLKDRDGSWLTADEHHFEPQGSETLDEAREAALAFATAETPFVKSWL